MAHLNLLEAKNSFLEMLAKTKKKTSTRSKLTIAAQVHCMKPTLVVEDHHIPATIHLQRQASSLHDVFLLPNEVRAGRW